MEERRRIKQIERRGTIWAAAIWLPLALSGCVAGVPLMAPMVLGSEAAIGAGGYGLDKMIYGDEPRACRSAYISDTMIECAKGRENIARTIALGGQDYQYDQMVTAVARCDAGKIPAPPLHEDHCDKYRAYKQDIEARIAGLKNAGVV
jgi:hypothetical protein